MNQAVVITGSGGWLGRNLLQALDRGIEGVPGLEQDYAESPIRCLDLAGPPKDSFRPGFRPEFFIGDIRRSEDCQRLFAGLKDGLLFHLAGVIHPSRTRVFEEVNVQGTAMVLRWARNAGIRRAVIMSSNSPFGCNPHMDHVFDEQSPYHPYMGYGRSKMKMEQLVLDFGQREGMEVVLIRAPWFYGPYQPARQTLFFQMVRDGKFPLLGKGDNRRSMVFLENLAQGLLLAGRHSAAPGQAFWIADENPYPMTEIVQTVENLLRDTFGIKVAGKRLRLPSLIGSLATQVDRAVQSVGLYHQKIHVLSEMNKTIACTAGKACKDLGYRPLVSLEEGMRRSIQWCIDQGLLEGVSRPQATVPTL